MIITILKILLVIIIAILLLVLLLSMFSIVYSVDASNGQKGLVFYVDIKYLFGAIRCKIAYDKKLIYGVRIFTYIFNYKTPKKKIKYTEEYEDDIEKEDLSYIFDDKDQFISEDTKKMLIEDRKLYKKADKLLMVPIKKRPKEEKKKQPIFAKIFAIIKEKDHTTIKHLYGIIKDTILLLKPKKTKIKFNLLDFNIQLDGKVRVIRLIYIAIRLFLDKNFRDLLLR